MTMLNCIKTETQYLVELLVLELTLQQFAAELTLRWELPLSTETSKQE